MVTLIHGELGTMDDVTEPLDPEMDHTGILNIVVEPWEQVDRIFLNIPLCR
jgi:hypothetical protein